MLGNKKIAVVLPAYNAEKTLINTYKEIPLDIVDNVILVDDCSGDHTAKIAKGLGIHTIIHTENKGYGGNQKTCYREALKEGSDIIIMLHPDYQYAPKLITAMASLISEDIYDVVIGSRIIGRGALKGGMPLYKYISNRFLTFFENIILGYKLTEYHTGYRAFSRDVLNSIPFMKNSDDFVFDNEILAQIIYFRYRIGEISCPTKYFKDASSIDLWRSIKYGIGVIFTCLKYLVHRLGLKKIGIFVKD